VLDVYKSNSMNMSAWVCKWHRFG